MSTGEVFGYIASALVFATFYMRTMSPLRIVAIASNVVFIVYALIEGLTPILILHSVLLPLNVLRLMQIQELVRKVERAAGGDFSPETIIPFMKRRFVPADEILFTANDLANEIFYIIDGEIFLPEVQTALGRGEFVGEFALFSKTGRRTATAIARTDCTVAMLTKKALLTSLIQHPQLGIHLLRVVTIRLLENAERHGEFLASMKADPPPEGAVPPWRRLLDRVGPRSRIALLVALGAVPLAAAVYQPLYVVLGRDAAVTSWLNVATAPIAGTVENFAAAVGERVGESGVVATIVNHNADRSGVIRAENQVRQAETRFMHVTQYSERVERLAREWTGRRVRYADGFRRDLDLDIQDLDQRVALLGERETLAEASAKRKRALRSSGATSQADEDLAVSEHRDLQITRTQLAKALERVRERRRLAEDGIFIQQDGKEPEWSWRSLDEINLEALRASRAVSDAQEELGSARAILADERNNFQLLSTATIRVPASVTIWSSANNASVKQGDPIFSWVDCSKMLVDVPASETLAALLQEAMPAVVTLEGEEAGRPASVLLTRGASSRLREHELASTSRGHTRGSAQVVVALADPASIQGCPIGRRAFVSFPGIRIGQYIRAWLPGL